MTKLPRPCPQYPPFTLRYGKMLVLLKLAAHGDPGAATRRSQALRVAARAFEVILFDGAGRQKRENCIPPLSRPRPQAVIAPVPGPLAVLQPRTEGKT